MKLAIAALLVLHGAIHLLGFVKAFGLAQVAQLVQPISRPMGALWLLAAVTLAAAGIMLYVAPALWWKVAAGGLLLSQLLILMAWGDAWAGTVANVVLAVPVVLALLGRMPGRLAGS